MFIYGNARDWFCIVKQLTGKGNTYSKNKDQKRRPIIYAASGKNTIFSKIEKNLVWYQYHHSQLRKSPAISQNVSLHSSLVKIVNGKIAWNLISKAEIITCFLEDKKFQIKRPETMSLNCIFFPDFFNLGFWVSSKS